MNSVSNLTCLLHASKAIGWLCLERECFSRVMCNVCAVKNHNKNHKVEELEAFEQKGLLNLILNGIQSNSSSKSITSNSNSDSSTEKFFQQAVQNSNNIYGDEMVCKNSKKECSKNSQNTLVDKNKGEQQSQEEKNVSQKRREKNVNLSYQSIIQPIKKKIENIMQIFKQKKYKIDRDFKEQQLRKKQQKEAAIFRIKQYESLIKNSQDVQEIQKSLDEAISIIYNFSKGSQRYSNQQINNLPQEDEDEAILLRPLSTSGESVIRGGEEDDCEDDENDDDLDFEYESDYDDRIYELDDKKLDVESECVKSFPEDVESDIEVNSLFKAQPKKEGEEQNIFSESSKVSQDSEIQQVTDKFEEGVQPVLPVISKRVYLKKKELLNQLQNYFLELTKVYFDNIFTQDFCKLVQDQIDSIMNIPLGKVINSEKKFLDFVENKWQADYKLLQESLNKCISSLVSKISDYNTISANNQQFIHSNSARNYLISQYLSENIQVSKISLEEPNSRIRLLQASNYPIQSPVMQGAYTIPQQVIVTQVHPHQMPMHAIQNTHMQIQNRITLEDIPTNYPINQQQYFTTVRQQGMTNIINIPQQIQQQQSQLQQQINSSTKQYAQQKYAFYQQTPQAPSTQFTKQQFITSLNYNQIQHDQQMIQQTQLRENMLQNPIINQAAQYVPAPLTNYIQNPPTNTTNSFQTQAYNSPNITNIEKVIQIENMPNQSHLNTPLPKQQKPEKNPYMQTTPFSHQKNNGNEKVTYEDADENQKVNLNLENKLNMNESEDDDPNSPIHYIQKKGSGGQIAYQTKNS